MEFLMNIWECIMHYYYALSILFKSEKKERLRHVRVGFSDKICYIYFLSYQRYRSQHDPHFSNLYKISFLSFQKKKLLSSFCFHTRSQHLYNFTARSVDVFCIILKHITDWMRERWKNQNVVGDDTSGTCSIIAYILMYILLIFFGSNGSVVVTLTNSCLNS